MNTTTAVNKMAAVNTMTAVSAPTLITNAVPVLHLDYATRDYDGFIQLMTQVIGRLGTAWTERAAADLGMMVVELLAYELDRLAYAGDRAAEEGFLETARRRESVRLHAALGDYALDRGNATRGYQWFQLAAGASVELPARTQVAAPIDPDAPALRLFAETLDVARLDARRNSFTLAAPALARSNVLRLASKHDLRTLGLSAGMTLVIGTPLSAGEPLGVLTADDAPLQLAIGEAVQIATVMAHGVELTQALRNTWPSDGAWVLGNIVEVRRGLTSDWALVGRGGATLDDIEPAIDAGPHTHYMQLRMEQVRRLRAEVEDARPAWATRPSLHRLWTDACCRVTDLRRALLTAHLDALDVRVPAQRAQLAELEDTLISAADKLRAILTAIGHAIPDELAKSTRVTVPAQKIDLPPTPQPILWMDRDPARPARSETLAVAIGRAGAWSRWHEQPDLLRSAPDDPHYVVEIDGNSNVALRFGDGITGAALPADCMVMARWVTGDADGDQTGDDLRAGALSTVEIPDTATPGLRAQLAAITATSNPLPTTGGRAPEALDGIAARVEQNLEQPAVPVTAADYHNVLGAQPGIAESAVRVRHGAVDLVIRPAAGVAAAQLLDDTRAWLDAHRLAGATVQVRLPRALVIDIGLVVEVHPDVSAADLRYRVQRALAAAFGEDQPPALGRVRERAEVYRLVEAIPGVQWSQVVAFDVADRAEATVREQIAPASDQLVRCDGIEDQPAGGQITIWAARRFALQLTITYASLDTRPELDAQRQLRQLAQALLSGPAGLPAQQAWTQLTIARIDGALAGVLAGAGFTVRVTRLIRDRRAVSEIDLDDGELAILDTTTIVDGGLA